jgi:hypothetical protein
VVFLKFGFGLAVHKQTHTRRQENIVLLASFTGAAPMRRPGNPSAISMARMAAETKTEEEERCAKYKVFKAIDDAYRKGESTLWLWPWGIPPTSRTACILGN